MKLKHKGFTQHHFFQKAGAEVNQVSQNRKSGAGFTLIELLVVIAVIGMLASVVLVSLGPARAKARDAKRQADLRQISLAMEMCNGDSACGGLDSNYCTATAGANTVTKIGGPTTCISTGGTDYMNPLPVDPTNSGDYQYTWLLTTATDFCMFTRMEATGKWATITPNGARFDVAAKPTSLATCR